MCFSENIHRATLFGGDLFIKEYMRSMKIWQYATSIQLLDKIIYMLLLTKQSLHNRVLSSYVYETATFLLPTRSVPITRINYYSFQSKLYQL